MKNQLKKTVKVWI